MNVRERTGGTDDGARLTPAPARLAARYRSLFEVGRGGMGTVEVALDRGERQDGTYERVVALKRMHPSARDRRHAEMFLREARLAAWLVHPNVVHAFDFGDIDGELFLALEYVEGETLSTMVKAARERTAAGLPAAIVASILADACEGLHAAHELRDPKSGAPLNVIHRDVSPHNVMVSFEGHVKLLDFGVARVDLGDPLTRTGEVKGKTAYMSPEQAMGEPLDRRSDLFSVGAVLFECLAGRKMWGDGTDMETLRKLALEPPPRLEEAAPHAPRALCELHARLVAKAREERPATAEGVARELREAAATVSAGAGSGAAAHAALMESLFAETAARRKRLLDEAIRRAAPSTRVEVVRLSLAGPTSLAALTPPRPPATRSVAPASVRTVSERPAASMGPATATKTGVVVSVVLGLLLAGAIVAFTSTRGAHGPEVTTAIAPASAAPSAASAPAPPSSASSIATAPPVAVMPPVSPSPPPSARAPAPASPRPRPRPGPSASAPSRPLDVDPNPL